MNTQLAGDSKVKVSKSLNEASDYILAKEPLSALGDYDHNKLSSWASEVTALTGSKVSRSQMRLEVERVLYATREPSMHPAARAIKRGKFKPDTILALIDTYAHLQMKFGKGYSYATQNRILELLLEYHQIKICRRTLNRYLRFMQAQGLISRLRRHFKTVDECFHGMSSLVWLCRSAANFAKLLAKKAKTVFKVLGVTWKSHNTLPHTGISTSEPWKVDISDPPITYSEHLRRKSIGI